MLKHLALQLCIICLCKKIFTTLSLYYLLLQYFKYVNWSPHSQNKMWKLHFASMIVLSLSHTILLGDSAFLF